MIINKLELFSRASGIASMLYQMDLESARDWDLYVSAVYLRNCYYDMISEFCLEDYFLGYCKLKLSEDVYNEIKNTAFRNG